MSTQENGLPQNVISNLPASVNISSSTNANPIVITTATPHGLTNGDFVSVNDHRVNTSANGTWKATVLGASTYSIPVAGVGVGGATGTSQSRSFGTTFAIPSDGVDNENAASVNVPFEALADRTSFLVLQVGFLKLVNVTVIKNADPSIPPTTLWDTTAIVAANTYGKGSVPFQVTDVQIGDLLDVELTTSAILPAGGTGSGFCLFASNVAPGAASSYAQVPGSAFVYVPNGTGFLTSPIVLRCSYTALTAGSVSFLVAYAATVGSATTNLFGDYTFIAKQYRSTGVSQ